MGAAGLAHSNSAGDLVGQIPYLLLVVAMLPSQLHRLRGLIAVAAAAGLIHALVWSANLTLAFWWGLLLLINLLLLGRRFLENNKVRFTADEDKLVQDILASLPPIRARELLDQGFWLNGREGDALTREDETVSHLFYLASGDARVMSHDRQVGICRAGDLIGEVTVLSGDQASVTVILNGPARFWCAPATALRPYLAAHDDVRRALEQGFAASLKSKLRASNQRIARAGGVTA